MPTHDSAGSRTGKRVTLSDIAKATGVTKATVSIVVNNKPGSRISPETRQRILHAVDDLGYRPDVLAQTLSRGSSPFIGIVSDALATTPFAGEIIRGAQAAAWAAGYALLIANTESDAAIESSAIDMMLEHRVTGIIYSTWYHREVTTPDALRNVRHVLVNCFDDATAEPAITPDEEQGGFLATTTLLEAGHRSITFINSDQDAPATTGRLAGYQRAMLTYGAIPDVVTAAPIQEGGYAAAQQLLARSSLPTGVFCYNDRVAMGVYDACGQAGKRVPDDISIVGFDNQEVIAAHLRPPLTTVALPHYELGVAGIQALLRDTPSSETLACPPVLRDSVAAAHEQLTP